MSKLVAKIPGWSKCAFDFSKPKLQTFWKYAKVELRPPTPSEVGQAVGDAQKGFQNLVSRKWSDYTVRQGFQNTLVATEVLMWFFVGEIIGRRSLIGYKV